MKKSMVRRIGRVFLLSLCVGALTATTAYAAGDDPLAIVNNLSDFIFSIIKAVGIIILGWGVVYLFGKVILQCSRTMRYALSFPYHRESIFLSSVISA